MTQDPLRGASAAAAAAFHRQVGHGPSGVWWAPGRVNLIGEHTDYNDGYVLPLALPFGVAAAAGPRSDGRVRVRSVQQDDAADVALEDLRPGAVHGWTSYVLGVVWALHDSGAAVGGLDLVVSGDVPVGAGLSSSAALGCAVALAVDGLASAGLDRTALAAVARRAENDFVGAPTGIMDQLVSMHAKAGHLLFLDTRSLDVEHVPLDLPGAELALLVVDTRTPHALVSGAYAERRRACHEAAQLLGVPALRDVTADHVDTALAKIADSTVARRARHVVTENARVLDVVELLRNGGDPRRAGSTLTASHVSMRDDFEITVPQVDLSVDVAISAGAHGARMTGGGFGGCVIALIERDDEPVVRRAVERAYHAAGFAPPGFFTATPGAGARRIA